MIAEAHTVALLLSGESSFLRLRPVERQLLRFLTQEQCWPPRAMLWHAQYTLRSLFPPFLQRLSREFWTSKCQPHHLQTSPGSQVLPPS